MNRGKRLLFQTILWGVIWLILGLFQNLEMRFVLENTPIFAFQISLIAFLIYYAAPFFFEEKRYKYFLIISLVMVIVFTVFGLSIIHLIIEIPPDKFPNGERIPPPPLLVRFTPVLVILLTYLLALFIEGIHFLHKKEQETTLIKNEALQSELRLLKSQINPHFLFNTLNNIYALAEIDADKTQQSISYLSHMLRYILYECERPLVSPQKEVTYIENYIKLFSLKSSKKYPIKLVSQIVDATVQIAPMVLLPFVENAIKHGNIEKIKEAFMDISLQVTSELIHFKIENSIPKEDINKDKIGGIGIENVRKRLAIIYPNNHNLTIDTTANIFKVDLTIQPSKNV